MTEPHPQLLARREAPFGLAIQPDQDLYESTDPRAEAAIATRWGPRCERLGAALLGVRDVPTTPVRLQLDGVTWMLEPLNAQERLVPATVYHRWRALEAAEVPFQWWLWGEEQPQSPRLYPVPAFESSPLPRVAVQPWLPTDTRDPIVIGVIPTAPQRGLWVLIGRWFH